MKEHKNKIVTPRFEMDKFPRARICFLAVANAGIIENEMFSMKPRGVYLHFTRIPMRTKVNISNLKETGTNLGQVVDTIMPGRDDINVVCYNCTSGSFIINDEDYVIQQIESNHKNIKGTTMLAGVVSALEALKAQKIVIGTAYTSDINELERKYFKEKGFEVLDIQGLGLMSDKEMNMVTPDFLVEFATSLDHPNADAIFLSCGALRSSTVIQKIESIVEKPVITSNQASLWNCLRLAGIEDRINGFGQLFEKF